LKNEIPQATPEEPSKNSQTKSKLVPGENDQKKKNVDIKASDNLIVAYEGESYVSKEEENKLFVEKLMEKQIHEDFKDKSVNKENNEKIDKNTKPEVKEKIDNLNDFPNFQKIENKMEIIKIVNKEKKEKAETIEKNEKSEKNENKEKIEIKEKKEENKKSDKISSKLLLEVVEGPEQILGTKLEINENKLKGSKIGDDLENGMVLFGSGEVNVPKFATETSIVDFEIPYQEGICKKHFYIKYVKGIVNKRKINISLTTCPNHLGLLSNLLMFMYFFI